MSRTELTGGVAEVAGRVAGAVLAAIRAQVGLTQEQLAGQLGVGLTTVQAWESGRRPLVNSRYTDLQRLRRHLHAAGATASPLHVLERALAVDAMYTDMTASGPQCHPLGLVVPDRATTELLAWPLTGSVPRQLLGTPAQLEVAAGVRDAAAADLRHAVNAAAPDAPGSAMMRRQVKFLVAGNPASVDWVQQLTSDDVRAAPDLRRWSARWPVARSQAVAAAAAGDLEPIRWFIEHGLDHDQGVTANLNYWAYWVGEYDEVWGADADMLSTDARWSGEKLLDTLLAGIVAAPYRDLSAHALWTLLRHRKHLAQTSESRVRIIGAVEQVLSESELYDASRRRLEQVSFLAESAG